MEQEKLTQLPISRIRTVMKTSPSIGPINTDALFLMCRAAEMFIEYIAKNAHQKGNKTLDYKHLAAYVESKAALDFLVQVLPDKITVKEYKQILEERKGTDDEDSDSDEESSVEGDSGGEEENESDESGSSSAEEGDVISINSSSSDEKENSKNISNKKTLVKHKTGDSP
ncbi:chromatin accessibility complex protein 1 [Toxorhynchites rutilus septentrionalis]|uniref:chromatin accessibility complex protein 1 n=1 Tax=Toxorhynchites rutilus septentrionalis TaxID=329112 RepID=UPI0024791F90|nr:chromatin accessibility complex protein 1 [Toxorhynchites rutilus septentrionalis]